ncbi:MAG: 6-phospho-beta-glucosidase [Frankiales bacterium]|nr:6-phospho-beta-glucosidase [Frankiales bacterium]
MKLAILGGGGFRVPLVYQALLASELIDEVSLFDTSPARLRAITQVLGQCGPSRIRVRPTTVLDEALPGADFVFSAIRVGGLEGRVADERIALAAGVLGQETTGAGGIAYALRTVPIALDIAERVQRLAPSAFVINFTNPAGLITEAMQTVLGPRVIGICDTPTGLARRVVELLGLSESDVELDYVGLNHLGWLRRVLHRGQDLLPGLLAEPARLSRLDEARMFGVDWLRLLGVIPNEYLYYFYYQREALAAITGAERTRGEFLAAQQHDFYRQSAERPEHAWKLWQGALQVREATYLAESRAEDENRHAAGGGYEQVALGVMNAIAGDTPARLILNVANGSTIAGLDAHAVVEVPCVVDRNGARPLPASAVAPAQLGLMLQLKAVERLTIAAAQTRRSDLAVTAFALHPLVDSVSVARTLSRDYDQAFGLFD